MIDRRTSILSRPWPLRGATWVVLLVGGLPARAPARLASDAAADRGRFLVEEHNCCACHRPEDRDRVMAGLTGRQGPDLSKVGERVHAGWIYRWLKAPDKVRPGAVMPRLFADDEAGRPERYTAAAYLASLGGPLPPHRADPATMKGSAARGQRLFASIGCRACHAAEGTKEAKPGRVESLYGHGQNHPLVELGSKTTQPKLAAYLMNPLATDPSGRMPQLLLQQTQDGR